MPTTQLLAITKKTTTTLAVPPKPPTMANGVAAQLQNDPVLASSQAHGQDTTRPAPPPPATATTKKGKQKKALDQSEASNLVSQRIKQLELDNKKDADQQEEIEREVKKANRELNNQIAKMDNMQKIEHLTKRCSEFLAELKRHERESIKNKKRSDQLQKEKDQSRTELGKTVGLKEKLEKLCRELQKENNKLKNENKTLQDNQVRNQNSWDEKYSTLLQKLDDYQEEKDNPRKLVVNMEVEELFRTRFKSLIEQYELRELYFQSLMRTKELEVQFHLARYERERKTAESEMARSRQLNSQVQTFSKTEAELRTQLNVYVEKFKQVEDTLNNSNDLFLTFRKEMEDMSKKTKRLEKENENWRRKHEAINQNVLKMAEERTRHLKELEDHKKKEEKLKGIIMQMQQQGRGIPQGMAGTVDDVEVEGEGEGEVDGEDSEYEYEDEEEDEGSEEYDDDDLTEEEAHPESQPNIPSYGPDHPPPPMTNGHA